MSFKRRGFTLIELLITISLIAILSVIAIISFQHVRNQSKLSRVSSELTTLATATTQFAEDNSYVYPTDVDRGLPPGLEKYLPGNAWPTSVWPHGVFDYDAWPNGTSQVYQISYRLCGISDPIDSCSDPDLFPTFVRDSSVFYCISGNCIPHKDEPTIPGYCVNCKVKKENY